MEIDSFTMKFKQLLINGFDADLKFKSEAGKAFVTLNLCIDGIDEECDSIYTRRPHGNALNARDRRRKRRDELKTKGNDKGVIDTLDENEIEAEVCVSEVNDTAEVLAKANNHECNLNEVEAEVCVSEVNNTEEVMVSNNERNLNEVDIKCAAEEVVPNGLKNVSCDNENELPNAASKNSSKENTIMQVYAIAEMTCSREPTVTQDEIKSLVGILKGKEHLRRNVGRIARYDYCKTNKDEYGTFTHTMPLVLDVDVSHLWENPRSYIYHHLGRDSWKLSNGTTVKLSRIHQK